MIFYAMLSFADRLRAEIQYKGLLQKEVAAKADIKKRALDMYLGARASMPSADIAVRLAKVLGVSVEYLVTGKDSSVTQDFTPHRDLIAEISKLSPEAWAELKPLLLAQIHEKQKQEQKKNKEQFFAG